MDFSHLIASVGLALTSFFGVPAEPMMLGAQAALTAFQGGTGTSSPSGILYGDETIRLKTVTIGSNLTFSGGTLSATGGASSTLLSDSNTFTNTITGSITGNAGTATALAANGANCSAGNYPLGVDASGAVEDCTAISAAAFPFTPTANYNSTSTPLGFLQGLFSNSSTTLNGNVLLPGITDKILSTDVNGKLFGTATSSFNAGTASSLAANGANCSAGSAAGGVNASGAAEDCTDYEQSLTAGDALTRTGDDFDFDGGATPAGDLGGTWASPSVTDDSHAHTGATLSGIDISSDTNAAATYPVVLTNDTFSLAFGTTTANNWSQENNFNGGLSTSELTVNTGATIAGLVLSDITGSTQCLQANSSGNVSGTGTTCVPFSYPFPSNATTTLIAFSGGLSSASTTLTGPFIFANATGTNATTTNFFATLASSTSLYGANLSECSDAGDTLNWNGGAFSCGTDADTTYTAGDALTLTGNDIDFDGGATPSGDLGGTWASPSVTDDSHAHTGATISGLDISDDTDLTAGDGITLTDDDLDCDTASASVFGCLTAAHWTLFDNKVSSTSIDTSTELAAFITGETGSGALVFGTAPTISNATLSSTTLTGNFVFANATGTNATTTNFAVTGTASTSKFFADGLTSCTSNNVLTWTGGVFGCEADDQGAGGAYPFTPGTFGSTNTSATSTAINGIGGFISTASSTLQKLTIELSTTTAATTTQLAITSFLNLGGDSIDELVGDGLDVSSGDLIFDCSDVVGTALTCTGEDLGVTANSIGDTQLAFDTGQALTTASSPTFANITDSGLTSGRVTYAGASGLLSDEAAFTYNSSTDVLTTVAASTTNLTVGTWFQIPSLASFTSVLAGAFGLDTTQNQLKIGTGSNSRVYATDEKWMRVPFASTTQGVGSTTIYAGPAPFAQTFTTVQCDFSNFMGVSLYDGTNRSTYFVASSTIGTTTLATNNSFNMGETIRIDVGTSTNIGAAVRGGCTFKYRIDPT